MFTLLFFALFLATFSTVSPQSDQTSLCPWNGIANADNFTLLAVFKTNETIQKPLALGSNGLPDFNRSVSWLGSAKSIDSIIAKYFVLIDGEITAYGPNGSLVGVSNQVANNSGQLTFSRPENGTTDHTANVYCELFNTSPHGVQFPFALAVNGGGGDYLSLCQSTTSDEFIVIYNAVGPNSTNSGYKPKTCVDIDIQVLPAVRSEQPVKRRAVQYIQ